MCRHNDGFTLPFYVRRQQYSMTTTTPSPPPTNVSKETNGTNEKPSAKPKRHKKRALPASTKDAPNKKQHATKATTPLKDILQQACAENKKKGWRAKQLGFEKWSGHDFRQAFFRDYTELKGFRSSLTRGQLNHHGRDSHGKFQKGNAEKDPLSIAYLTYSWGVGKNYPSELAKTRKQDGSVGATTKNRKNAVMIKQGAGVAQAVAGEVTNQTTYASTDGTLAAMNANRAAVAAGMTISTALLPQSQLALATRVAAARPCENPAEVLTLFQHAHESKYKKGWRARQKGLDPNTRKARTFQKECLRDLVTLRGSQLKGILHNDNDKGGPKSIRYLTFAWGVGKNYFTNLVTKPRADSNYWISGFVEALGRAQGIPDGHSSDTGSDTSEDIPLVERLLPTMASKQLRPLKDILAEGCALNKEKGWRARQLGFPTKKGRLREFRNAFILDMTELRGFRSAMSASDTKHHARGDSGKFEKANSNEMDPFSINYLSYAWGVGKNYSNALINPSLKSKKDVNMQALAKESERKEEREQIMEAEQKQTNSDEQAVSI